MPVLPHCAQPPHKVDLNEPQKCVLVQLLKACAALTVVDEYRDLAKFNLRELATQDEAQVWNPDRASRAVLLEFCHDSQRLGPLTGPQERIAGFFLS